MDDELKKLLFDLFEEGFYAGLKVGSVYGENSLSPSELTQRASNRFKNILNEKGPL